MSLLFNMLSRLGHSFYSKGQVSFNCMAAVTICSDFWAEENSLSWFPLFSHLFAMKWQDWMQCVFSFLMLNFKPVLLLSPRGSSLLSSIRVVSSAYLRLLIFLLANLIPVCASSSLAFLMMYSAYKLNKQGDNIQPWCTLFPYLEPFCCSISSSNCCFLTCIQVSQESGQAVWYSHHCFPLSG